MKYKIIVDKQSRTNPSSEKREYEVDIEELRFKGDVYDSLIVTKDENYVMRKLRLTEFYVLEELEEPVKQPLENVNIELFEGDNYIYLMDMIGNKFYAEYLIKNEFNDIYVTLNQMSSAINQSASEVQIAVNQKLVSYSTTEEMNTAITTKANEINLEVNKKVNDADLTGANISLRINNDTSEAKIKADKININGVVSANNNFKIDTDGSMKCKNAEITGGRIKLGSSNTYNSVEIGERVGYQNPFTRMNGKEIEIFDNEQDCQIIISSLNKQMYIADKINQGGGQTTFIKPSEITTPKLTQTSLADKKKNFERFNSNAIDIINQIELYKYNLKGEKDEDKKHIGFIIGDDYKYSKEVTSNDNTGVDLYSFISLCCKAIQEQQEQIKQLQNKVEEANK